MLGYYKTVGKFATGKSMTLILFFIIILLSLVILALVVLVRKEAGTHGMSAKEEFAGICASALDKTVRKKKNKEKALAFIRERASASNEEIRRHLGVSSRSVVNYLDDLEKEGKVEQIGSVGQGVIYRPK